MFFNGVVIFLTSSFICLVFAPQALPRGCAFFLLVEKTNQKKSAFIPFSSSETAYFSLFLTFRRNPVFLRLHFLKNGVVLVLFQYRILLMSKNSFMFVGIFINSFHNGKS